MFLAEQPKPYSSLFFIFDRMRRSLFNFKCYKELADYISQVLKITKKLKEKGKHKQTKNLGSAHYREIKEKV